ncbi:zinc-dependent metalloprotease [Fulvivirga sp. 29W222]|uniref:Zinc-dependent metalloprotease n=1 Tax=Fulvivirga marina TaxID=2494733 RepID=A0A937FWZ5_9BACT|nr:zinc-dependent metalloprotease [Fulvivirga marina]MBL6445920.1 zinc-dependent metalloprotease [Fulvivirga marina]
MKRILFIVFAIAQLIGCQSTRQISKTRSSEGKEEKKETRPYDKIVTNNTISDEGLFLLHQNDDKVYYEIPDSLLGRDMLLVSRISKIAPNFQGGYINAGSKTGEMIVRWYKKHNNILLKSISYNAIASDSLPIYLSVESNNYAPTLKSFKIKAFSPDSTSVVIDATDLFTSDIPSLSALNSEMRKEYKIKKLDAERSFIESAKSFPLNIEVKHEMTYVADEPPSYTKTGTISMIMNQSMILLPKKPMMGRLYDERVGWFTVSQIDYGSEALKADSKSFIRRWRLEPKDLEAYARGELVEPVKPIVYYLDPATPMKWRKYFKMGIEDWQKAFETAGFKNAIIAKDPPSPLEDPDFSPEDVRYSIVRYVASTTRNAIGPSVSDPRSGEIIESDIIWYHNHLRSYRNRYLLETGAANPKARTLDTPEEDIGEMMRMVIAHEVGHALGLPHNMKASAAYPTDSLRSGKFTQKYGIAATIMDYARYNYVAQPGDRNIRFIRQLGPYDHYAINWGYRVIPGAHTATQEKATLKQWIKEKSGDPTYQFGSGYGDYDPTSQTEGIGADPVKASKYGLANLKIVAPNLIAWTTDENENYGELEELYGELISVWGRYIGHVTSNIGGVIETLKTHDQPGVVYQIVPKKDQQKAMNFLLSEAFSTPDWLIRQDILRRIEHAGAIERVRSLQVRHLNDLLSFETIQRLIEAEAFLGKNTYTAINMMDDLQNGLWSELKRNQAINVYRRTLQKAYVERLEYLMTEEQRPLPKRWRKYMNRIDVNVNQSDIRSLTRAKLTELKSRIRRSAITDKITTYHLKDIEARIELILNPK